MKHPTVVSKTAIRIPTEDSVAGSLGFALSLRSNHGRPDLYKIFDFVQIEDPRSRFRGIGTQPARLFLKQRRDASSGKRKKKWYMTEGS